MFSGKLHYLFGETGNCSTDFAYFTLPFVTSKFCSYTLTLADIQNNVNRKHYSYIDSNPVVTS
jgi:hypothetical protein